MRLRAILRLPVALLLMTSCADSSNNALGASAGNAERQLTRGPGGRILSNTGVWSPDGQWIVYDTRPDEAGSDFAGETTLIGRPQDRPTEVIDATHGIRVKFTAHDRIQESFPALLEAEKCVAEGQPRIDD